MRTNDLINALAADAGRESMSLGKAATIALIGGAAVTATIFFVAIGMRADIAQVLHSIRFLFKFAVVLALGIPAAVVAMRLGRPGTVIGQWGWALVLAPVLLVLGVLVELATVSKLQLPTNLVGPNWQYCVTVIPMLAAAPLAGILFALRYGAPTNGPLAGAAAGIAAASIAAAFYASHCPDDSPLFVATSYPIAIGIVALFGSLIGKRMLRW